MARDNARSEPGSAAGRRNTRLAGHSLIGEGRPLLLNGCCGTELTHGTRNQYDRIGHGHCTCGEFGPCETTNRARQVWHMDHKNQVRTDAYFAEHPDV